MKAPSSVLLVDDDAAGYFELVRHSDGSVEIAYFGLVERFFGVLTERALKRGSHTSVPQLRDAILASVAAHNDNPKPFRWTKTADEILDKMRRFGTRTLQVHGA